MDQERLTLQCSYCLGSTQILEMQVVLPEGAYDISADVPFDADITRDTKCVSSLFLLAVVSHHVLKLQSFMSTSAHGLAARKAPTASSAPAQGRRREIAQRAGWPVPGAARSAVVYRGTTRRHEGCGHSGGHKRVQAYT